MNAFLLYCAFIIENAVAEKNGRFELAEYSLLHVVSAFSIMIMYNVKIEKATVFKYNFCSNSTM